MAAVPTKMNFETFIVIECPATDFTEKRAHTPMVVLKVIIEGEGVTETSTTKAAGKRSVRRAMTSVDVGVGCQ